VLVHKRHYVQHFGIVGHIVGALQHEFFACFAIAHLEVDAFSFYSRQGSALFFAAGNRPHGRIGL